MINFDRLKLAGCTQDRRWDFRVRGQLVNLRRRSPLLRSISACISTLIAILSLRSYNYDLRLRIEISSRDDCVAFNSWSRGSCSSLFVSQTLCSQIFLKAWILIFHALFTGIAIRKAERKRREMGRQEKTLNREHGELKPVDNGARWKHSNTKFIDRTRLAKGLFFIVKRVTQDLYLLNNISANVSFVIVRHTFALSYAEKSDGIEQIEPNHAQGCDR